MILHINPTVSEDVVPINDDLEVRYSVFKNDTVYVRPAGSWRLWTPLEFVPPVANHVIADMHDAGVAWGLYEHVSIAIGGRADYVFTGPENPITQVWTPGFHNVENGGGYLPAEEFTRRFYDDFALCCIIQKFGRTPGVRYRFEVVTGPLVLDADAVFVHYATGARQRQTDFNLAAGDLIEAGPSDIAIIGRGR
jgi:hypothetical protein